MADLITDPTPPTVNYNYSDVQDGFGLETYYLYARKEATGTGTETATYHITKDATIASEVIGLQLTFGAITACGDALTAETQATKVTFSTPAFALPKTVEGTAIIDFGYAVIEGAGSPSGTRFYPLVEVYHYDGSTETQLGSTWYGKKAQSDGGVVDVNRAVAFIALGTKRFARGDILRIKLGGAACGLNGIVSVDDAQIGIDPLNRDCDTGTAVITPTTDDPVSTTIFKARIPFRVEV